MYKSFTQSHVMRWIKPFVQSLTYSSGIQKKIIFVFGVQRSGTNMLMEFLDRSPDTYLYNEIHKDTHDNYILKPVVQVEEIFRKRKAKCIVIKCLLESQRAGFLLENFSKAYGVSGVWVFRHYHDVIRSNIKNWPEGFNQIHDVINDTQKAGWRSENISEDTLDILRQHVMQDISQADAQALFWWYRNKLFFEQNLQKTKNVHLIDYASFVDDPGAYGEKLSELFGIRISQNAHTFVHKESLKKKTPHMLSEAIEELCQDMFMQLSAAAAQRIIHVQE